MAVDKPDKTRGRTEPAAAGQGFQGRYLTVGANVALTVVLAVALFVFVQWVGYTYGSDWMQADLTSSGVNSLRPATKHLVGELDGTVRLVSLYPASDLHEENEKFLEIVTDLFALYQGVNRSKIETESINPLKDHDEYKALLDRLKAKKEYAEEAKPYDEFIAFFRDEVYKELQDLLTAERDTVKGLIQADLTFAQLPQASGIDRMLTLLVNDIDRVRAAISEGLGGDMPNYRGVASEIKTFTTSMTSLLTQLRDLGPKIIAGAASPLGAGATAFLGEGSARYGTVLTLLTDIDVKGNALPTTLKLEDLFRQVRQDNAIVVETDDDARVLSFSAVWPRKQDRPGIGGVPRIENYNFAGEAQVTSAMLQITQDEKPAVVFVRFGGSALFASAGFNPMQPRPARPPYANLKRTLERLNFRVEEWNLQGNTSKPTLDPKPDRIVYVVLPPVSTSSPSMPGMPPNPAQQFNDQARQKILNAIKADDSKRALFLAGWSQPTGPIPFPTPYQYADYLETDWGLDVQAKTVVVTMFNAEPGKWTIPRGRPPLATLEWDFNDHLITKSIRSSRGTFPAAAPIQRTETVPEGVTIHDLVTVRESPDVWGETNVMGLQSEAQKLGYFTGGGDDDVRGPFPIAVAAAKGDEKVAVISSAGVVEDDLLAQGFTVLMGNRFVRQRINLANEPFFVNCLQWLHDQEDQIGLGFSEVAEDRLDITEGASLTAWRWFAWAGWPAVALFAGAGVWFVRRR